MIVLKNERLRTEIATGTGPSYVVPIKMSGIKLNDTVENHG